MKYDYKKLRRFIAKAHKNQKRKYNDAPYSSHLFAVEKFAIAITHTAWYSQNCKRHLHIIRAIALFHDYLEDEYFTNGSPLKIVTVLKEAGYSQNDATWVLDGVQALTKAKENFDLLDYLNNLKRIRTLWMAKIVKLADLQHNMSDLKEHNLKKYNEYYLIKHYLLS